MTERTKIMLMSATLMAFLLPAVAQNASTPSQTSVPSQGGVPTQGSTPTQTTTPAQSGPPTVQQRKENQQDRIANGVSDGQLSASETRNLEKKESQLNQEERDMKAQDNGHLTSADRAALRQQQNHLSNQIYKDKHNASAQNQDPKTKLGQRAENQQDRIGQGIKDGQLNASQTANLENKEAAINHEVAADRQANGGHLTQQQKAQVKNQQNNLSHQIYKDKHSGKK